MSTLELGSLLSDPTQSGAYFVDIRDREALEEAALGLDFAVAVIDCAGRSDKDEILDRFAQALRFPDWFGANWDALEDCLGDLSWWPAKGYVLVLDHIAAWRGAEPEAFAILLEILNDAAAGWAEADVPFWAVIPMSAESLPEVQ